MKNILGYLDGLISSLDEYNPEDGERLKDYLNQQKEKKRIQEEAIELHTKEIENLKNDLSKTNSNIKKIEKALYPDYNFNEIYTSDRNPGSLYIFQSVSNGAFYEVKLYCITSAGYVYLPNLIETYGQVKFMTHEQYKTLGLNWELTPVEYK